MGTRSRIAIKTENEIKSVYCHWDGYPTWNGRMLFNHLNNRESAEKIIELGDISSLGDSLECPEGHTFDNKIGNHTVFYGRDRKERNISAIKHNGLTGLINDAQKSDAEYIYLFDCEKNKWLFTDARRAFKTPNAKKKDVWIELTDENTKEK